MEGVEGDVFVWDGGRGRRGWVAGWSRLEALRAVVRVQLELGSPSIDRRYRFINTESASPLLSLACCSSALGLAQGQAKSCVYN